MQLKWDELCSSAYLSQFDRESWSLALCKCSSTLWLLCHLPDVNGEPLDIITAIRKNVDLQSKQPQDQTRQTSIPFLTATISGYLLRGFPEPDVCSLFWRTVYGFSCVVLPSCSLNPCTLQTITASSAGNFTAKLSGVKNYLLLFWTCCLLFYLIPAHSCSKRDSKHIISCSLSLCHLWIYTALSDSTLHSYSS